MEEQKKLFENARNFNYDDQMEEESVSRIGSYQFQDSSAQGEFQQPALRTNQSVPMQFDKVALEQSVTYKNYMNQMQKVMSYKEMDDVNFEVEEDEEEAQPVAQ